MGVTHPSACQFVFRFRSVLDATLGEPGAAEHLGRGVDFHRGHDCEQAEHYQDQDDELLHFCSSLDEQERQLQSPFAGVVFEFSLYSVAEYVPCYALS